ncbi:ABC transporter ATPase [Mucilaginibacter arboris]|uniref:ABC transporter ATPase n=1 Tax=Mucilaginibacter arboris TaxID=2682090 RepID=A0A7K1SX21_9SPHI|nr:ABC transporter ATPase [Mucilaginibacter arboris]MVN21869.1 ABC transporter ATPase [Mucilaginibacter arboris]
MEFSPASKIWIYQSNRKLNETETDQLQQLLDQFASIWTAHNQQLKAAAQILYNRFIILLVDESQAGASGCSIDKSVHFMKSLEQEFGLNLFDRFNTAYIDADEIRSASRQEFEDLLKEGKVNNKTIVFNNLVANLHDFKTKWQVPLKDSWHARVFGSLVQA